MNFRLPDLRAAVVCLTICGATTAALQAQENPAERLRREQDEVLRKTERLRELMTSLLERYQRDGRAEQVKLLVGGLEHLERSRLLGAAAEIPTNLDAGAYDNAVREQATVIAELESLLDILLERQSIENLDEQIEETTELIERAGELINRQRELRVQGREAREDAPKSAAERELIEALDRLADAQRNESFANEQRAGRQLPVLESAQKRIANLLEAQRRLEESSARQLDGSPSPARAESFELGAIEQAQRELNAERSRERELERLAADAADLARATENDVDPDRLRVALDQVRARLEAATKSARTASDNATAAELEKTREALQAASPDARDAASKQQLQGAAEEVARASRAAATAKGEQLDDAQRALRERANTAAKNAEKATDEGSQPTDTSRSLERAAESMEDSLADGRDAAASETSALRRLAQARRSQRAANPDPSSRARDMANTADDVARDLEAGPESGAAEQTAAGALQTAEQALRDLETELGRDEAGEGDADPDRVRDRLESSRAGLENAMQSLEDAMDAAKTEGAEQQAGAAASRQRELRERAEQTRERIQAARDAGDLDPKQADAASEAMDRAQESMDRAAEQLDAGQPSSASSTQSRAAKQLDEAAESIERNRPVGETERQELEELARRQAALEEDIIRLAELAEERENKRAAQALQRASEASQRARQRLDQGEQPEAEQEQQEVEQQLEQAQDELEEERDRYMDLRQEELLFRIREELTQFLEAQRPLTQQTAEAGAALAEGGRLSRPERRKLNQVAERESELITRTEFILAALVEEGVLVFSHSLRANVQDLKDIRDRLAGRRPDPGEFTVMLQRDVEDRALKLIEALQREQERKRQERQNQQQQGENQFGNQKEPLVPLIAELKMLRQMEEDLQLRTRMVKRLLDATGADGITEFDIALSDRLATQHGAISEIFGQIRSALEQQMEQAENGGQDPFGPDENEKDGKEKGR